MITATARLVYRISATARMVSRRQGSCAAAIAENSDGSFSQSIPSGGVGILADTVINVYVNGTLNQSITRSSMIDRTININ